MTESDRGERAGQHGDGALAPVIPLFGARVDHSGEWDVRAWDTTGADASASAPPRERAPRGERAGRPGPDAAPIDLAERALMRKLRGRSLSVSEARRLVREHEVESDAAEALIAAFLDRGYLDDARLAEQLVHTESERRGAGRSLIAQTLRSRGIPTGVVEQALADYTGDDAARALDVARSRARSLARLDPEVALRRLLGQLARRGYGGSVALEAARTALAEASA